MSNSMNSCCPILLGLTEPASYKYRMPNRAFEPTVTASRFDNTSLAVAEFNTYLTVSEPLYQVVARGGPKEVNVFGRVQSFNTVETQFYSNWDPSETFLTSEAGEWPNHWTTIIAPTGMRDDSVQKFLPFCAPKNLKADASSVTLDTVFATITETHLAAKVAKMAFYGAVFVTEMTGTSTTATVVSGRKSALTVADPGDLTTWDHPDYSELMATPDEYIAPEDAYQDAMYQFVGPPCLTSRLDPPTVDKSSGEVVWSQVLPLHALGQKLQRKMSSSGTGTSTLEVYSLFEGVDYHMNNTHAGMRLTFTEDADKAETASTDLGTGYSVRAIWFIATSSNAGNPTITPVPRIFNTAGDSVEIPFEPELGFAAPSQIQVTRLYPSNNITPNTWDPVVKAKVEFLRRQSTFMTAARLPLSFIKWENLQKEAHLIRRLEVGYEGVTTAIKRDVDFGTLPPVSKISKEALVSSAIHVWNDPSSPFAYTLNTRGVERLVSEAHMFTTSRNVQTFEAGFWKNLGKFGKGILTVGKHLAGPLLSRIPFTAPYAQQAHEAVNAIAGHFGAARYHGGSGRRNVDAMYDEDDNLQHENMMDAAAYHMRKLRR